MESEMNLILTVAVIMIFAVLCITTTAWSEPFLFLLVMGVAILAEPGHQYIYQDRVIPDQQCGNGAAAGNVHGLLYFPAGCIFQGEAEGAGRNRPWSMPLRRPLIPILPAA